MTREETKRIVGIVLATFPSWKVGETDEKFQLLIDSWSQVFKDDDFKAVEFGLMNYIQNDTSGYAPSPGQIRNGIKQIAESADDTEEMVGLVRKAVQNGNYGYTEEYAKLPPILQKAIGCAENLRAWANQPNDQFESVTLSAVRRAYRATKEHVENVKSVLPITENLIEQGKQNLEQLEVPKAVPQIETLPEVAKPENLTIPQVPDEVKEAIVEVWNSDPTRQTLATFHFRASTYRTATLEILEKVGLETLLTELRDSNETLYLAALGVINNVHA